MTVIPKPARPSQRKVGARRPIPAKIATIEMNKDVEQYLRTSTRFWLVKPSVTLAGITGLETLVSGNYVAISPGEGEPTHKFKALAEEPPLSDAKPGLHLTIKADRASGHLREAWQQIDQCGFS